MIIAILANFLPNQKLIKKHILPKPDEISEHSTMGAQWLDSDVFLGPFGHHLFIKLRNHPNLLNCNTSPAKLVLLNQALELWQRKSIEIHVFSRRDQGPIFSHFIRFYLQKCKLGTPFKNAQGPPKSTTWRKNIMKSSHGMDCS
jgi:hypothetical protein